MEQLYQIKINLFLGFNEFCGLTLLNKKGVPTYEIPNRKRSIIDFGMTNAVNTVLKFQILPLTIGVTPQTCHKVIELSLKIVPKPVVDTIPQVKSFNFPGNKQDVYMNCILCKFMDLSPISPPEDYNHIMNIFQTTKRNIFVVTSVIILNLK